MLRTWLTFLPRPSTNHRSSCRGLYIYTFFVNSYSFFASNFSLGLFYHIYLTHLIGIRRSFAYQFGWWLSSLRFARTCARTCPWILVAHCWTIRNSAARCGPILFGFFRQVSRVPWSPVALPRVLLLIRALFSRRIHSKPFAHPFGRNTLLYSCRYRRWARLARSGSCSAEQEALNFGYRLINNAA